MIAPGNRDFAGGALVFLFATQEDTEAVETLNTLRQAANKRACAAKTEAALQRNQAQAAAIWHAQWTMQEQLKTNVEHVRSRGALLHLGHAVVDRSDSADYTMRPRTTRSAT